MATTADVRLLDAGDGRRLERFGAWLIDRPAPAATWPRRRPGAWRAADLRFERGTGWAGQASAIPEPWHVEAAGLRFELRATPSGGVGLFPEQLANVPWLEAAIEARRAGRRETEPRPTVLNLFAHTGLLTLIAARAGAAVTHVDAARPAVAWARRNAEQSGIADLPIRWIVDDTLAFVRREGRRRHRYDGLLVDPPTYGHGGSGGSGAWRLEADLGGLLEACAAVSDARPFVLVSAHATDLDPGRLADAVRAAFGLGRRATETVALELEADSGAVLPLGVAVRTRA